MPESYIAAIASRASFSDPVWYSDIACIIWSRFFVSIFKPITVELERGVQTIVNVPITYSNANNTLIQAGTVLYTNGIPTGTQGSIKVSVLSTTTLNNSGTFTVKIEVFPFESLSGNPSSVSYIIDSGIGVINFTYYSKPEVQDINLTTPYNTPINFTPTIFTSKFTDLDGDVTHVRALGTPDSLQGYKLNGADYTGTWIPISETNNLVFNPDPAVTTVVNKTNRWQARDSRNNESN